MESDLNPPLEGLQGVWQSDREGTVYDKENRKNLDPRFLDAMKDTFGYLLHTFEKDIVTISDPRDDSVFRSRVKVLESNEDRVLLEMRMIDIEGESLVNAVDFLEKVGAESRQAEEVQIQFDGDEAYWLVMTLTTGKVLRERFRRIK